MAMSISIKTPRAAAEPDATAARSITATTITTALIAIPAGKFNGRIRCPTTNTAFAFMAAALLAMTAPATPAAMTTDGTTVAITAAAATAEIRYMADAAVIPPIAPATRVAGTTATRAAGTMAIRAVRRWHTDLAAATAETLSAAGAAGTMPTASDTTM